MKVELHRKAKVFETDGHVDRIGFENPTYYRQQLEQLKGHRFAQVTIKAIRALRSNRQNAYWHGVCYPVLAELTGYTEAEVKEVTKRMYLTPRIVTVKGEEYQLTPGTSDLTTAGSVAYTDAMRQLARDLGGEIPTPSDAGYHQGDQSEDIRHSESYPDGDARTAFD